MGARFDQRRRYTTTNHKMKPAVAAVYDRLQSRTFKILGGHRPPLQLALVTLFCACIAFAADTKSTEWPTYGHDSGGMRFSPLKQITPANVSRLQLEPRNSAKHGEFPSVMSCPERFHGIASMDSASL